MSRKNSETRQRNSKSAHDFRISDVPVVCSESEPDSGGKELDNVTLPPVYGGPVLVAIARGPGTIFLYWNIDWPTLFAKMAPVDRQVHLRVHRVNYGEEQSVAVEPMAGNCYIAVPERSGPYHVEMGYYQPADTWHSITASNEVTMPRDNFAVNRDVDLATIPLHLGFQRLLDLLGAARGDALAKIISQSQTSGLSTELHKSLRRGDHEILKAMNLSLDEIATARRAFVRGMNETALDTLREAILSFGSTSPSSRFSPSSWQNA
jgi:hypothetical protein